MNHWNSKSDLKTALAALEVIAPSEPSSELTKQVALSEKALGFPLPADLRTFYRAFPPQGFLGTADVIRIYPVNAVHLWQCEFSSDFESEFPTWAKAQYLAFGATVFGDEVLYSVSDDAIAVRRY